MKKISDSNFEIAMKLLSKRDAEKDASYLDSIDVDSVEVSGDALRKFRRALKWDKSKALRANVILIAKRAVAACLIITTFFFGTAMCISPIRTAFFGAVVTWYEDHIGIYFSEDGEDGEVKVVEPKLPAFLPEGWTVEIVTQTDFIITYDINGPDGAYVYYQQMAASEDEHWLNDESAEVSEIVFADGRFAYLVTYDSQKHSILWNDTYTYHLKGRNISAELLISIAQSIK